MARTPNFGVSRPVSTVDFNERVKRILEDKPGVKAPSARSPSGADRKPRPKP
jgi:hypothetical protein